MTLLECFDKHGCDKGSGRHRYDRFYEPIFAPLRNDPVRVLEIGVFRGASVASWLNYFPHAEVIGVDTFERVPPDEIPALKDPRVSFWTCDSAALAPRITQVDILIDDGSHKPGAQLATFDRYWSLLKDGGRYFIEDVIAVDQMLPVLSASVAQGLQIHRGSAGEYLIEIRK